MRSGIVIQWTIGYYGLHRCDFWGRVRLRIICCLCYLSIIPFLTLAARTDMALGLFSSSPVILDGGLVRYFPETCRQIGPESRKTGNHSQRVVWRRHIPISLVVCPTSPGRSGSDCRNPSRLSPSGRTDHFDFDVGVLRYEVLIIDCF